MRIVVVAFLAGAVSTSCSVDLKTKPGSRISCETTADCPGNLGCGPSGYCEAAGAGRPTAATPTVVPSIGTIGTRFVITVRPESALSGAPQAELLTNPITPVACEEAGEEWLCAHVADGTELGEQLFGRVAYNVALVGTDSGITAFEPAGFIELDFLAPAVVEDTTAIRVVPGPDNVLDEPTDLGPDSVLQVSFTLNKVLTESLSDTLGTCDTTTVGACVSVWLAGTTDVDLTDASTSGRYLLYEVTNPSGALLGEEVYTVRARARDFVGNVLDPVDVGTITVDNTPPNDLASGQLDALVVHRDPWGSRANATARLAVGPTPASTLAPGHALLVWRGTSLSPVEGLGEMRAESDGSVPVLELEGDLPRVYVSPVDGAGNVSSSSPQLLPRVIWTASLRGKIAGSAAENPHELVAVADLVRRFPTGLQPIGDADGVDDLGGAVVNTTLQANPWKRILLGSPGPAARDRAGMVLDRASGRVILFGGATGAEHCRHGPGLQGDTWELAGDRWRELNPVLRPSARAAFGMIATDHMGVVLFGGCTESGQSQETFRFDGTNWRQMSDSGPSARHSVAMAFAAHHGQVVLFGGESFDGSVTTTYGDTWEWDGTVWTERTPGPAPTARSSAAMAYDPVTQEVVMFGGIADPNDVDSFFAETWLWNGTRWLDVTPAAPGDSPPASASGRLVFDDDRGQVVLYGGLEKADPPGLNDRIPIDNVLWAFDGVVWTQAATWTGAPSSLDGPVKRHGHGLVYDPERRALVAGFGAAGSTGLNPTYSDWWWSTEDSWMKPSGVTAPVFSEPVVAMDPTTLRPLLFGTSGTGATWVGAGYHFLGGGWSPLDDWSPDPRTTMAAIAGNPITGQVLLAGGYHPGGPTDMGLWRREHPSNWGNPVTFSDPITRRWASMVFDGNRERVLLFGGWHEPTGTYLDEFWVYETNDPATVADDIWVEPDRGPLSTCDGWPAGRYRARMEFDPVRQVVVIPGGHPGNSQVWELDDTCWRAITPAWDAPAEAIPPNNFITEYGVAFDAVLGEMLVFHYEKVWSWNGTRFRLLDSTAPDVARPATVYVPELDATFYYGGGQTWLWRSNATVAPAHAWHVATPDTGTASLPTFSSVQLSWTAGADVETGTNPGVALAVWEHGRWRPVGVANTSPALAPTELIWSSDAEWAAIDPVERSRRLRRMVALNERVLSFAVLPLEPATVDAPTATITTDYLEVAVEYRLD